jgi:hypothetical protein
MVTAENNGQSDEKPTPLSRVPCDAGEGYGVKRLRTHQAFARPQLLATAFDEPGIFSVRFGLPCLSFRSPRVVALVTWGMGKGTVKRVCDVRDGVMITGLAETILVNVEDRSEAGTPDEEYEVVGTVSRGVRPASSIAPTYYAGRLTVGPGKTEKAACPLDYGARAVSVGLATESGDVLPPVELRTLCGDRLLASCRLVPGAGPLPLAAAATHVELRNFGRVPVVGSLTYAIDG